MQYNGVDDVQGFRNRENLRGSNNRADIFAFVLFLETSLGVWGSCKLQERAGESAQLVDRGDTNQLEVGR